MKNNVKVIPLGGQAENGKSMYCVEIDYKIFIIDVGFRFPEVDILGVDVIIPNFEYLRENKNRVAAIIITHGHDDVMASLPYLLEEINVPIFAPNLTADLIEEMLVKYNKHNHTDLKPNIIRVKRDSSGSIAGVNIEFFPVTHSIPGSVGVALETKDGYIVYSGEYIIDFGAPEGFRSNIQRMMEIGKKGVLVLMGESSGTKNPDFTSPTHKLTPKIEPVFEETEGRIIISMYAQNIYRIKELVELAKKYNRKILFYGRDKYDITNSLLRVSQRVHKTIIDLSQDSIIYDPKLIDDDQLIVVLTGTPRRIYHDICDIIDGGDDYLKIKEGDTFIVASPVLPGTEKIANRAQNELYKTPAIIHMLKNKDLNSMHAASEDVKVILQTFKPKYYMPIKGEYQHFVANMQIAQSMEIPDENIILCDNGEVISFTDGQLDHSRDTVPVGDVMIDGIGVGDVGDKVIDDRIQLSKDGVLVIGITVNRYTRRIETTTDVQTRGFIYLKDSEYVIKEVLRLAEEVIQVDWQEEPYLDVSEIRQIIKERTSRYLYKETGKKPVILSVIIEI